MQTITKTMLIEGVAERLGGTKRDADQAVHAVLAEITNNLATGNTVKLTGFGNFEVVSRKAREGRNVVTGETISIPPKRAVKFKPGKDLKARVA